MDYDDTIKLRELCVQLNILTEGYNQAITLEAQLKIAINDGISENYEVVNKSNSSKEKQILHLCHINKDFIPIHQNLLTTTAKKIILKNRIKNVEAEINVLKKTYESTPR